MVGMQHVLSNSTHFPCGGPQLVHLGSIRTKPCRMTSQRWARCADAVLHKHTCNHGHTLQKGSADESIWIFSMLLSWAYHVVKSTAQKHGIAAFVKIARNADLHRERKSKNRRTIRPQCVGWHDVEPGQEGTDIPRPPEPSSLWTTLPPIRCY